MDFSALYRAHARDVHRFALFLSGDPSLADDVTSETFVRVWHARARVDLTTVRSYLFAIVRNLHLQERRRGRRLTSIDDRLPDLRPGPDRASRARDELDVVLRALQALPEVDRAAVLMRAEGGLPYEEIGAALGLSATAARVRVHRARVRLAAARANGLPIDQETKR